MNIERSLERHLIRRIKLDIINITENVNAYTKTLRKRHNKQKRVIL